MEKIASFFGLNFSSSVSELDTYTFLPSQNEKGTLNFDSSISGLPTYRDDGYIVSKFIANVKDIIYGKFLIKGNTLYLEPMINTAFWEQINTPYQMPDKLIEYRKYNAFELKARQIIGFARDSNETFTYKDNQGYDFEVVTTQKTQATVGTALSGVNITKAERVELLKNVNDVSIPWALGSRRTEVTFLEQIFEEIQVTANRVINSVRNLASRFGGQGVTSLPPLVSVRKNALRVSQSEFGVAKILNTTDVNGERLLRGDSRSKLNAEYLWDEWHKDKSFVSGQNTDDNWNQWRLYTDEVIDFSFSDFVKLINNSYFSVETLQPNGGTALKSAKAEKFEYNFGANTAKITYRVREVYNKNLDEKRFK